MSKPHRESASQVSFPRRSAKIMETTKDVRQSVERQGARIIVSGGAHEIISSQVVPLLALLEREWSCSSTFAEPSLAAGLCMKCPPKASSEIF